MPITTVVHTFETGIANQDLVIDTDHLAAMFRLSRKRTGLIPWIQTISWIPLSDDFFFFCTVDPRGVEDKPDVSFAAGSVESHPGSFVLYAAAQNEINSISITEKVRNQIVIRNGLASVAGVTAIFMFHYELVEGTLDWKAEIVELLPEWNLIGKRQMSPGQAYFQTTGPRNIVPRGGQEP